MEKNEKKLGRPRKCSDEKLKNLVMKYYLYEINGDARAISANGIYTKLSTFAKNEGIELEDRDFSRNQAVRDLIKNLSDSNTADVSALVFTPLDIEYFLGGVVDTKERRARLTELNAYYREKYMSAAKVFETYQTQEEKIAQLHAAQARLTTEKREVDEQYALLKQTVCMENEALKKENIALRKMINEYITEPMAISLIEGESPPLNNATKLVAPSTQEPAILDLKSFEDSDSKLDGLSQKSKVINIENLLKKNDE